MSFPQSVREKFVFFFHLTLTIYLLIILFYKRETNDPFKGLSSLQAFDLGYIIYNIYQYMN